MRYWIFTYLFFVFIGKSNCQNESLTTQFAYNKMLFNPAFAGAEDNLTATLNIRDQWSGLEGAPTFQSLILDIPVLFQNVGIGLSFKNQSIGIRSIQNFAAAYSYQLKFEKSSLSIGLSAQYNNQVNDFTDDRLLAIDGFELDPSISRVREQISYFNLGFGLNYNINGYYFSLGTPGMLTPSSSNIALFSQIERSIILMMGKEMALNSRIKIFPEVKLTYASKVPISYDLQLRTLVDDVYMLGFNYRSNGGFSQLPESLGLMAGMNVGSSLLMGIAYDINLSEFNQVSQGSIELFIRYRFGEQRSRLDFINPRYF